ncbi:MAG: hypothetical protein WEB53_09470 [Akkermansiaceae bacterium]
MNSIYADPAVRQRLVEYLGGDTLEAATAIYLTHSDGCQFQRSELHPPRELQWFLDRELDIARSLADHKSLLLHLDLEYVNFDAPGEAYADPVRTFQLQEPVVRVIEALLLEWGIEPLHLITGQGHHFVWRVRLDSEVARRIAALNPAPELVAACLERLGGGVAAEMSLELQGRFTGIALLMEYFAHRIKWEAAPQTAVPVEITAVHVGPCSTQQRELISIDISEYGDPLHTRMVRMPYTNYLKPGMSGAGGDSGVAGDLPQFKAIPLYEMDVGQAIECRQNSERVKELARRASGRIPLWEKGTGKLLDEYLSSSLRAFHNDYYSVSQSPEIPWEEIYGGTLERLPPCVGNLLEWPNDRLLKPAGIQLVTRVLMAEGWHPRHVAGLIRSKFENPEHGWGVNWGDYEAGTRADFYTRLFAGLWATGVDELVDFNCVSTREKGFCIGPSVGECNLYRYHQALTHARNP